ncbi:MAG TPA: hypothetical protein PL123_03125 [Bacteroidales bacterium]|nr:hypothetical protein [Bacteroidales bacterium]
MALSFIRSSGNIITEDFCISLATETRADYVKDKSFGEGIKHIDEVIATAFERLRKRWEDIRVQVIEDKLDNAGLRKKWIIPFLEEFAYKPVYLSSNLISKSGTAYQIPYKGRDDNKAPVIQIPHSSQDFDLKDKSSRTHPNKSPHDALQLYLNTSNHRWAILINGKKIRILRDFYHSITKGFLEFDLEAIFENASSEHFRVLYRVLHISRFENQYRASGETEYDDDGNPVEKEDTCLLEVFHKKSRETGVKIGTHLRDQVVESIEKLGNGFAEQLNPDEFQNGKVKAYYSEILNIIYRLLFLMFAEQKGWLPVRNLVYAQTYSIGSLRDLAEKGGYDFDEEKDLWEGLKITFRLASGGYTFPNGDTINAFGGQLFSEKRIKTVAGLSLKNKYLLDAVYRLSYFSVDNIVNRINYANLAIDELGSVYESLLDFEPKIAAADIKIGNRQIRRGEFYLDSRGTERKTTGSYYTDSRLVAQLIDSALVPVIDNALAEKLSPGEKEKALLDLKVADIACGSGAFLIAGMEKLGERLALIRKGDEERPTDEQLREAKRDVLLNCIYGVDLNPMAVELAKFSLWITASLPDMPLSFLDHKIKCGNSLIGATPELVKKGIPEGAYNTVTLDNPAICAELRKKVKKELQQISFAKEPSVQYGLKFAKSEKDELLHLRESLISRHQEDAGEVDQVEEEYHRLEKMERKFKEWILADVWTSAFFIKKTGHDLAKYPTNATLEAIRENQVIDNTIVEEALSLSKQYRFFHFHLEFPEVFEKGGFDCLLGNPPWEKINFKDEEYFSLRSPEIANARNKAERKTLIENLPVSDPQLYLEYQTEKRGHDCLSVFFRVSGSFPFTGVSRINLYSIFAEQYEKLINENGATGNVLPTGIILDDNNKDLFLHLVTNNRIDRVIDYENRKGLFPDVDSRYRFCLFVTLGSNGKNLYKFYQLEPKDDSEFINITLEDIKVINPNSNTCPSFKTKNDFEIAKKVYKKWGVLLNENQSEINSLIKIRTPFNMSNDSHLFEPFNHDLLPLYEAKYIHQYNHRYSIWINTTSNYLTGSELENSDLIIKTQYYLQPKELFGRFGNHNWYLVYRMIVRATDERTMISSIIPGYPCGNSLSIIETPSLPLALLILGAFNSFVFDFFTRQTVGGINFNHWILKQLPVINFDLVNLSLSELIQKRAFQLTYTASDLKGMAKEFGFSGKPFIWNDRERFQLQCELDAIYAHLYGLEKSEMDYILDTFPIVKRKDIDKYGSYRTKETILRMYDEFAWVREEVRGER